MPSGMVETGAEGHAVTGRQALAQRACRHVDARRAVHIRYALEHSTALAQLPKLCFREKALQHKRGVEGRCGMALGQDEPVPVRSMGLLGIDMHEFAV